MPEDIQKEEQIFPQSEMNISKKSLTLKEKFWDFYYKSIPYFTINLAWFVMSLPVITALPALGGLYDAVMNLNQNGQADWGSVWKGLKKHWWLSLKWGFLVLFGDILLAANLWFYGNIDQTWAVIALMLTITIFILWTTIHQFSFPLLLLQDEKKIPLAIRNAFVLVMHQPFSALKVILLTLLIAVVSILLPPLWIFATMALIIHIRTRFVLTAIQKIKQEETDSNTTQKHQ